MILLVSISSVLAHDTGLPHVHNELQEYNHAEAVEFYADQNNVGLNPASDAIYFNDPNNIGINPEADLRYFAGNYPGGNSRTNFDNNQLAAQEFLQQQFNANYQIEGIASSFTLDAENGIIFINNIEVPLNDFKNDESIEKIIIHSDGYSIINKETKDELRIAGDAQVKLHYQNGKYALTVNGIEQNFHIGSGEVLIQFGSDGELSINGEVQGNYLVNDEIWEIENYAGQLNIQANGNIKSDNAKVVTPDLYADGKFSKQGNLITAQDHASRRLGNTDTEGRTIIIDRTTGVGVKTQGQVNNENVKIHLDTYSDQSKFKPPDGPATDSGSQLAKQIRDVLKAPSGDNGGQAEVWIKNDPATSRVIVTAKGKTDVGFYNVGIPTSISLDELKPHFIGKNTISEFDSAIGAPKEINIRGQAIYSDGTYTKIDSEQDGATYRINTNGKSDVILADCKECQEGTAAITIGKKINVVGGQANPINFDIPLTVTKDGLKFEISNGQLGALTQAIDGQAASLGQNFRLASPCSEKDECSFSLVNQDNHVVGVLENFNTETNEKTKSTLIDFRIIKQQGPKRIVTTEQNQQSFQTMVDILSNKNYAQLGKLKFDKDPALRQYLFEQLNIDIDLLDKPSYVNKLTEIFRLQEKGNEWITKLRAEGLNIDDNGNPLDDKSRKTINRLIRTRDKKFFWYTAAKLSFSSATQKTARLLKQNCKGDTCLSVDPSVLGQARIDAKRYSQQRETVFTAAAIKANKRPDGVDHDLGQAALIGKHRTSLQNNLISNSVKIQALQQDLAGELLTPEQRSSHNQRIARLQAEQQSTEEQLGKVQNTYVSLINKYANSKRPDIAADLAIFSDDLETAKGFAARVKQLVPSKGEELETEISRLGYIIGPEVSRIDQAQFARREYTEFKFEEIKTNIRNDIQPIGAEADKGRAALIGGQKSELNDRILATSVKIQTVRKGLQEKSITPEQKRVQQLTLRNLRAEQYNDQARLYDLNQEYSDLVNKYLQQDRPDIAADLAIFSNDFETARNMVQRVNAFDQDKAKLLETEVKNLEFVSGAEIQRLDSATRAQKVYLDYNAPELVAQLLQRGDIAGAAAIANNIDRDSGGTENQNYLRTQAWLAQYAKEDAQNRVLESSQLVHNKALKATEDYEGDGAFDATLGWFTYRFRQISIVPLAVELWGGQRDTAPAAVDLYYETNQKNLASIEQIHKQNILYDTALNLLLKRDMTAGEAISLINRGKVTKEFLLQDEANPALRKTIGQIYDDAKGQMGQGSAWLPANAKLYNGNRVSYEDQAWRSLEKIQEQRLYHDGEDAFIEGQLAAHFRTFPGTAAAEISYKDYTDLDAEDEETVFSVTARTEQQYGKLAGDVATLIDIPLVAVTVVRGLGKVAEFTKVTQTLNTIKNANNLIKYAPETASTVAEALDVARQAQAGVEVASDAVALANRISTANKNSKNLNLYFNGAIDAIEVEINVGQRAMQTALREGDSLKVLENLQNIEQLQAAKQAAITVEAGTGVTGIIKQFLTRPRGFGEATANAANAFDKLEGARLTYEGVRKSEGLTHAAMAAKHPDLVVEVLESKAKYDAALKLMKGAKPAEEVAQKISPESELAAAKRIEAEAKAQAAGATDEVVPPANPEVAGEAVDELKSLEDLVEGPPAAVIDDIARGSQKRPCPFVGRALGDCGDGILHGRPTKTIERAPDSAGNPTYDHYIYSAADGWSKLDSASPVGGASVEDLESLVKLEGNRLTHSVGRGALITSAQLARLDPKVQNLIRNQYAANPRTTSSVVSQDILNHLGLGDRAALEAKVSSGISADLQAQLRSAKIGAGIDPATGRIIDPNTGFGKTEFVRGKPGVVLKEKNGVRTTIYLDDNGQLQLIEYARGDPWVSGTLDDAVNQAHQQLLINEQTTNTVTRKRYRKTDGSNEIVERPSLEEIASGAVREEQYQVVRFDRKPMLKTNSGVPISKLADDTTLSDKTLGFSPDVERIGQGVEATAARQVNIDGVEATVRDFTVKLDNGEDVTVTYPTELHKDTGTETLLHQRETEAGTIYASNNIDNFMEKRVPQMMDDVRDQGMPVYIHEGSRHEVSEYLNALGFDLAHSASLRFPGKAEQVGGYELWQVVNPKTGETRYLYANFKGSSKRQHIEAGLRQNGFKQEQIVVVDHKRPYQANYDDALNDVNPDVVIVGDGAAFEKFVQRRGGEVKNHGSGGITDIKYFEAEIDGKTVRIAATIHPNGELSRFMTRALVKQNIERVRQGKPPLKVAFTGDAGSFGDFHSTAARLSDNVEAPDVVLKADDMFTPRTYITPDGSREVTIDNPIAALLRRQVEDSQGVAIATHPDGVKHTNAYSANQEDIGYVVNQAIHRNAHAVDVEGSYIAEVLADAGADAPEFGLLFHVSDEVASGHSIAEAGHGYRGKSAKNDLLFEFLTGRKAKDLDFQAALVERGKLVAPPPPPPTASPPSLKNELFEKYGLSGREKGTGGPIIQRAINAGKTPEEVERELIDAIPRLAESSN